ncbi:Major Facilitator Superfamily protein [compost metagenome]
MIDHTIPQRSAIWSRPVQIITLALIFVGSTFATAEVSAVAITRELGQPKAASIVIGVYAIGSFIVGITLGALALRMPLHRQLMIAVGVLALTALPLPFAGTSTMVLATAVFISGIAISPTFITAFGLIERRVPETMLTEGITWVMTGIGIGMAFGAFVSGLVIDRFGAANGFWVSVLASFMAAIIIALGQASLSGASRSASYNPSCVIEPGE